MRILVTGADGFVGKHAVREFRARGDDVIELFGSPSNASSTSLTVDLRDVRAVADAIDWAKPAGVLHLAGASSVARSHENPGEAFQVNTLGTVNLLDAIRRGAAKARVVAVSSGEVYGSIHGDRPVNESDLLQPTSPYASSKVAAEIATRQFHASYGTAAIIARPFNHLGRGQAPHFVVPSFARQIKSVRGSGEIKVGNLDAVRDFSHVLDVVDAYRLLLERGVAGHSYNIASGIGRSIRSLLDELIEIANVNVQPVVDRERVRPIELPSLIGDATKLRALGWKPTRTVTDALREALDEAAPT